MGAVLIVHIMFSENGGKGGGAVICDIGAQIFAFYIL